MGVTTFRDAVESDIPVIVPLVQAAYRGPASRAGWTTEADLLEGQRVDAGMLAGTFATPGTRVLLAMDDEALVGCCELHAPGADGAAHLGMFAVAPGRQGGGTGRRILDEAERMASEEWGAARLELSVIDVRDELIGWYERRGYRRTGRYEAFPYDDERFGRPLRDDLRFEILAKDLPARR